MNTELLNQKLSEPDYVLKKNWIVQQIEFKLKMIDLELSEKYNRTIMQKVEHRIKGTDSIARKLLKKGIKLLSKMRIKN